MCSRLFIEDNATPSVCRFLFNVHMTIGEIISKASPSLRCYETFKIVPHLYSPLTKTLSAALIAEVVSDNQLHLPQHIAVVFVHHLLTHHVEHFLIRFRNAFVHEFICILDGLVISITFSKV